MGKNIVTQMNGHFLKLHFLCLKDHKGSIIVWIVIKVFGIFFINCKVYMFKATNQKCFCMFKALKP